jgi:hypothetical protein
MIHPAHPESVLPDQIDTPRKNLEKLLRGSENVQGNKVEIRTQILKRKLLYSAYFIQ